MVDLTPFKQKIEQARDALPETGDPRLAFTHQLKSLGYKVEGSLTIGQIERVDGPEDKAGKKSGWYVYHEIQEGDALLGIARFGSWKLGTDEGWTSRAMHHLSFKERMAINHKAEQLREQARLEKLKKQEDAASLAVQIYGNSLAVTDAHPYLVRKSVKPCPDLRVSDRGDMIVPIQVGNSIASLQFIDADGNKRFLPGGRIKGGHFIINGNSPIAITCEGLATGLSLHEALDATVYVAFNAGNLFEVASAMKSQETAKQLWVAGDNDTKTAGNPGKSKAKQAAEGIGINWVVPDQDDSDFNDIDKKDLKLYFKQKVEVYEKKQEKVSDCLPEMTGALAQIERYYNTTSGNHQPGFAKQTAIAICSIVLSRSYRTNFNNFPTLFMLNLGKSATGKEHIKDTIEAVLTQANKAHLIGGDGYTSEGAVFSALLQKPKHITVIDEMGRYLEAGRDMKGGNSNQREANTQLMQAVTRPQGIMRPKTYSTMTLKGKDGEGLNNRFVYNPAVTLVGMSTPETFFNVIDMGAIKDGFINRFLIYQSDAKRQRRHHKEPMEVPESVMDWINTIEARADQTHSASEAAKPHVIPFSEDCYDIQANFEDYCIEQANALEKYGMAELPGRTNEMSMRLALIAALSDDPNADRIDAKHVDFATSYMKALLDMTIKSLKVTVSGSEFEGQKKEILNDLRERGEEGITWSQMQKEAPYSKHKRKELKEILDALKDAGLASEVADYVPSNKGGRPTALWIALK